VLTPLSVLGGMHLDPRRMPSFRHLVGVFDPDVCRALRGRLIDLGHDSEMDFDAVESGKAVPSAFILPCGKAESSIVRKRGIEVPDRKDRCDPLEHSHDGKV